MKITELRKKLRDNLRDRASKIHYENGEEHQTPLPTIKLNGDLLDEIFYFYDENLFSHQLKKKLSALNLSVKFFVDENLNSSKYKFQILKIGIDRSFTFLIKIDHNFLMNIFKFRKVEPGTLPRHMREINFENVRIKRSFLEAVHLRDDSISSVLICMEYLIMWLMIILYDHIDDTIHTNDGLMECMMKECFGFPNFTEKFVYFSMKDNLESYNQNPIEHIEIDQEPIILTPVVND